MSVQTRSQTPQCIVSNSTVFSHSLAAFTPDTFGDADGLAAFTRKTALQLQACRGQHLLK